MSWAWGFARWYLQTSGAVAHSVLVNARAPVFLGGAFSLKQPSTDSFQSLYAKVEQKKT